MVDEIAKIMGNLIQIAQIGKVDKVKEVSPRPEEGKNMSSPFSKITVPNQREKGKRHEKKRHIRTNTNNAETLKDDEDKGMIDVVV